MNYSDKILKVEDITNLSYDVLMEAIRNGYRLEESNKSVDIQQTSNDIQSEIGTTLQLSPAACPTSVVQGTTHTITVKTTGGQFPLTIQFYVDNIYKSTMDMTDTGVGTVSFNYTFNEPVGNHVYKVRVLDSCAVSQQVREDSCTVSITAASKLASISIPPSLSLSVGQRTNLVVCKDAGGNRITCPSIAWSRSSSCCVNLFSDGTIEGAQIGSLTVRPYDSITGIAGNTCTVTVSSCPPISCSVSAPSSVSQGNAVRIDVSWSGGLSPYNVDYHVDGAYKTSQFNIYGTTTSNNLIANWSVGSHAIRAYVYCKCPDGTYKTCWTSIIYVQVKASSGLASMTAPSSLSVILGQTIPARIVCRNSAGTAITCPPISWSRSSNCCVNLGSNGAITGTALGSLTVRPYDAVTGVYANSISLTVIPCPSLTICALSGPTSVYRGGTAKINVSWSGGISPYNVLYYVDNVKITSQLNIYGTSTVNNLIANWSIGSHAIRAYIYCKCPNGTYKECWTNTIYVQVK